MKNFNYKNDIFLINYCISGRCEFHVTKDKYLYMKNNYTSIGTLTITDSFYYPTGYYLGFEVYICEDLLTADISKHIPIHEISTHTSISETSLKNYFNSMYGMNVSDYMRILRLKKAAELLLNTNISIAEISEKCGYSNQGRFAKAFKEHFGLLPLEYRHSKI